MRKPQGGVYAYHKDRGRVWVESVNSHTGTALVRYDPGLGMRSKVAKVPLGDIDFDREWKRMTNAPRRRRGSRTKGTTPFERLPGRWIGLVGADKERPLFAIIIPHSSTDGYTGFEPTEGDGMSHYIVSLLNEAGGFESFNEFMAYYMRRP